MQTQLPEALLATERGRQADAILRACVHCGFCTATCATYQVLGDELDGPRGRIYLIKSALETNRAGDVTRTHLDRCLTCRACETACPSGVAYGQLLEIGRAFVEENVPRGRVERWLRAALLAVVPRRERLGALLRAGHLLKPLLPRAIAALVPERQPVDAWPPVRHTRRVLLLEGCVQSAATPQVNVALARLLDRLGVSAIAAHGCCGGLALHMAADDAAQDTFVRNVLEWSRIEGVCEAVLSTASGCGVTVKDYGRLLAGTACADAAARLAARTLDVSEYLAGFADRIVPLRQGLRVAWHAPCTLQHGQRTGEAVPLLLARRGHTLLPVAEAQVCCGAAGANALLQPDIGAAVRERKLGNLLAGEPDVIATANVGCALHLSAGSPVPVVHWLQLLA
jgi:glycolate oxidase iron-sulfur subunit